MKGVTGVQVMKGFELVASSSLDTTVRLWTKNGHYIGTLNLREGRCRRYYTPRSRSRSILQRMDQFLQRLRPDITVMVDWA